MRAPALRRYRELLQAAWVREAPVGPVDETLARVGRVLRDADIPFAVAGGFAVIGHGYERFTRDVDLLVYARDLSRAMQALRAAGLRGGRTPIGAKLRDEHTGVDVDLVGTGFEGDERALARSLRERRLLPVIPVGHLILMKLESGRSKDDADVVELLKAGASPAAVARYLRRTWPALLPRFRRPHAAARTARPPRPSRLHPAAPPRRLAPRARLGHAVHRYGGRGGEGTPGSVSGPYGSTATARSGPPLPPRIFIGRPMNVAPRGGSVPRPARFSKMGTLALVSARWARKSRDGPWSIDAVSMPIERMRRAVVSHTAASPATPGKWRCAVSPGAALPR